MDDLERERKLLLKELDNNKLKPDEKANKLANIEERIQNEFEIDPT